MPKRSACPVWTGALLAMCGLIGCGGAAQQAPPRSAQTEGQKTWQRDQAAQGSPAPVAEEGDGPEADIAESEGDPAASQAMKRALEEYRRSLDNAARRDRELETLIRRYLSVTREVFSRLQRSPAASAAINAPYDPLPAWRFQARAVWELRSISARAGVVRSHLEKMARDLSLDLGHPGSPGGRAERLAHYDKVMACIEDDTWRRARHGLGYLRAASIREPTLDAARRAALLQEELELMRASVGCATLAADRGGPSRP